MLLMQRVKREDRKDKLKQFAHDWQNGQQRTLERAA